MKTQTLSIAALSTALVLAGLPSTARADDGATTAEVTRTTNYGLLIQEFQGVTISGVKKLETDKYGYKAGAILYADIEVNALVVPHGCNTSYYKGEILACTQSSDAYDSDNPNPITKVELGTIDTLGAGSMCVGLPPRPVHLKLNLVNGIGALFGQDRVYTFQFDGPANHLTQNLEQWLVRVTVNQATAKIEIAPAVRKNDEPVIPDAYTQLISCDTSGHHHKDGMYPEDNRLDLVVTKSAGDAGDARNYAVAVAGTSKSYFGPDSGPRKFTLVANPNPPQWAEQSTLSFLDASATPAFQAHLETRILGWKVNRAISITFKSGQKLAWATCKVTQLTR